MANIISSKDHPITNINNPDGSRSDLLETESYAQALAKFAMECETPLTIGVQGEWCEEESIPVGSFIRG